MARNIIDIGAEGNDGTGDSIREAFRKSNENFDLLFRFFGEGGQLLTTNLGDAPNYSAVDANKLFALNSDGTSYTLKQLLVGNGLSLSVNNNSIVITNTKAGLSDDNTPRLSYHLNAQSQMIGYLKNPDVTSVNEFNTIYGTNLNTDGRDFAVNKGYIDAQTASIYNYINTQTLTNINVSNANTNDILFFNGTAWTNGLLNGDLSISSTGNTVNLSIKPNSVSLDKLQNISGNSILGRRDGINGSPSELTADQIVSDGNGLKTTDFSGVGAMTINSTSYEVVPITTTGSNDAILKTGSLGEIDINFLKLNGNKILDSDNNNIDQFTPQSFKFLSASGSSLFDTTVSIFGNATIQGNISTVGIGSSISAVDLISSNRAEFSTSVITSAVTASTLTTGSETTTGTIIGDWQLSQGSKLESTYADLAEYYESDQNYNVGTVLVFGGEKEVTITNKFGDTRVAGVVSGSPAYVMNSTCSGNKICIALQGRVPVKVVGKVNKGDILVSSATPGCAVVNNNPQPGTIIGKALENKIDHNISMIEVAVGRF